MRQTCLCNKSEIKGGGLKVLFIEERVETYTLTIYQWTRVELPFRWNLDFLRELFHRKFVRVSNEISQKNFCERQKNS